MIVPPATVPSSIVHLLDGAGRLPLSWTHRMHRQVRARPPIGTAAHFGARLGQITWPAPPASVTTGRPAAAHACMPPSTLTASYPRWRRAVAARSDLAPDRQMATSR